MNIKDLTEKHKTILLIFVWIFILLIAPITFTWKIGHESIWFDESHTHAMINNSVIDIIKITSTDYHPPLYFVLLKIFTLFFGRDIVVLRLFSVVGTILLICLGFGPLRRVIGDRGSLIYAFFIIITPAFSSVSQDARMYSWGCFFVTASLVYGFLAIRDNKFFDWMKFTIFTLASAYTHHFALTGVFFLNLILFIWIIIRDRKKLLRFIIHALISTILFTPWIIFLIGQITQTTHDFWIPPITSFTLWNVLSYQFGNKFTTYISFFSVINFILMLFLFYYGLRILWIKKEKNGIIIIFAFLVYLATLLGTLIFSIKIKPILYPRYIFNVVGLLIIVMAYTISRLTDIKTIAFICFILFIFSLPQGLFIRNNRINGPMKEVAEYVRDRMTEDDVFLHGDEQTMGTFMYYFPDNKHFLYLPTGFKGYCNYKAFGPNLTVGNDYQDFVKDNKYVWLVNREFSSAKVSKDFISSTNYEVVERSQLFKIDNSWYQVRIQELEIINK